MKEKATIYDYARMCKGFPNCEECPLDKDCEIDETTTVEQLDKMNEIILKWCKEHPVKTRQEKFLEMFPNAKIFCDAVDICPGKLGCGKLECSRENCTDCRKSYWLAEVDDDE